MTSRSDILDTAEESRVRKVGTKFYSVAEITKHFGMPEVAIGVSVQRQGRGGDPSLQEILRDMIATSIRSKSEQNSSLRSQRKGRVSRSAQR